MNENKGMKTRDGGIDRDLKGSLGQLAVHTWLLSLNLYHEYSEPYTANQYGDVFDIKIGADIWDIKCRSKWNEKYFYNIDLLMGEHERHNPKSCDYYVFTTTDIDYQKIYILGGIHYYDLWKIISPLDPTTATRYPTAGYIKSKDLTPIRKITFKT